jgi:hypothetical protein
MSRLGDLRARAHALNLPPESRCAQMRLRDQRDVRRAVDEMVAYFKFDAGCDAIRVVVGEEDVGYVERHDAYELARRRLGVPPLFRGRRAAQGGHYGMSAYSRLMGRIPAVGGDDPPHPVRLRCPVWGCPRSPVFVFGFDQDHPLRCEVHPRVTLVRDV